MTICVLISSFFFFNDTATTEIYTLSLHDALPILPGMPPPPTQAPPFVIEESARSEEHTSELQSRRDLVCRLLLEKKKSTNLNRCETSLSSGSLPRRCRSSGN